MKPFMCKLPHWIECFLNILHKFVLLVFQERDPVCANVCVLLLIMSEFGKCSAAFVHRCYGMISVFASAFQLFMLLIMHVGSFSSFIWIFTATLWRQWSREIFSSRRAFVRDFICIFFNQIFIYFPIFLFWKSLRITNLGQCLCSCRFFVFFGGLFMSDYGRLDIF